MALTKIITDGITDDAVTEAKLANAINTAVAANTAKDLTTLSATNLTSGTIPDARLPATLPAVSGANLTNLPAANLTGTIDDARISASSVQQHASSFDDNKIINDISTLALQINALQNASKFSTNSVYVDNFNDAAGIASFSSMARNDEKYINIQHNYDAEQYWATSDLDTNRLYSINTAGFNAATLLNGATNTWGMYMSNPQSYNGGFGYEIGADSDFGAGFILTGVRFYNYNTNARFRYFRVELADSGGSSGTFTIPAQTGQGTYDTAHGGTSNVEALNVNGWVGATLSIPYTVFSNTTALRVMFHSRYNNGNTNAGMTEIQLQGQKFSSNNPTGNFISNAITAPSTTSMGAVILYKDTHGTATLNTDLKVYLSADNGSNFTQGTLVALSDFATGVKMAKVNDVTVTAGTQLKYKIEVTNQAVASKETRIDGVSLQY